MQWTRCMRSASRGIPSLDMPLQEATRIARRIGCLGAPRASSSCGSSSVDGATVKGLTDIPPLRRCTAPNACSDASPRSSSLEASWWTLQSNQRRLFHDSHAPTEGTSIAATMSSVNIVHIEGIVTAVQCGHLATNLKGPSGHAVPGRRTVYMTTPINAAFPTVLMWLNVADPPSPSCLLAVRCRLSPEVVEARWSAEGQSKTRQSRGSAAAAKAPGAHDERGETLLKSEQGSHAEDEGGLTEAKLRCVKTWAKSILWNRRVIVSGQLRMEEVYDDDLSKVVSVPVVEVAQDYLMGGVTGLDF
ncbi:hypothetical protein ABL78_1664 [Leptomonas seymouri]|uniref:Uncharacterized protein n=1 Tax=Leptomonas seymouri TaxID=5684 RepID=A0A0N1PFQ8_LEPSE|nr:hypothetical protein ABL78_1664 [Leptomonas seymouri]|eukprot:KPI89241.1 hypothetical protein ABL78_1664 [Leptomonas seymouri]